MIKITVAIPIYNAARHVKVTLDSLVHQTMSKSDFEVICVNDRSTDNSQDVIESFKKSLPNLRLINRVENSGGPMIPRNDAIEEAKGEYILFLDNDDFLGEETLERFYKHAEKNNSDVIYGKYVGVNGRKVPQSMFKKGNLPKAKIIEDNLVNGLAPHKMYRLSLLRENHIRFYPEAKVGEDQLFTMQCFIKAKVITVLSDYDYYFVVKRGDENLSLKYFPAEQFFFAFNRLMEFMNEEIPDLTYRRKLKIAFLNRFLRASRLRKYLLTNSVLNREQKILWLEETKKFISNHMADVIDDLDQNHRLFARIAWENDIDTLLFVHSKLKEITPKDISRIQDGKIYARFSGEHKGKTFNMELNVSSWNTTEIFLKQLDFRQESFQIKGYLKQHLLKDYPVSYQLVLIQRETGLSKTVQASHSDLKEESFEFIVDYQTLLTEQSPAGPWDLFVEAKCEDYSIRRRLGANRGSNVQVADPITGIKANGNTFSIKPYWTKNFDNLSLEVKVTHAREDQKAAH